MSFDALTTILPGIKAFLDFLQIQAEGASDCQK